MPEKVGLFIIFWAAPDKARALMEEVQSMAEVVNRERGTLVYGFHKISSERGEGVAVYELYENADAQRIHGESDAINALRGRLPELLEAPPERYQLIPVTGAKGLPF